MDVRAGDILEMKSASLREQALSGAALGHGFKIRCQGCGHEVMIPRVKAEKNIRHILREENHDEL